MYRSQIIRPLCSHCHEVATRTCPRCHRTLCRTHARCRCAPHRRQARPTRDGDERLNARERLNDAVGLVLLAPLGLALLALVTVAAVGLLLPIVSVFRY